MVGIIQNLKHKIQNNFPMPKLITVITCLLSLTTLAQTDSASKAKQLLAIEQSLMNALPGDTTVWSTYLDENWYIITEDGSGFHKHDFLKGFGPFPNGYSGRINIIKPVFVFHDNIAVLHYVADEYEQVYNQQLHTSYATANTWYQAGNSWKMIASQTFEIPQLPQSMGILDAGTLKDYTGTYQLTDTVSCTVSLEGNQLYLQKKLRKKEALQPETVNVFFRQSDTRGRKIFVQNEKGELQLLERRNGQDLVWKKIK